MQVTWVRQRVTVSPRSEVKMIKMLRKINMYHTSDFMNKMHGNINTNKWSECTDISLCRVEWALKTGVMLLSFTLTLSVLPRLCHVSYFQTLSRVLPL